MVPLTTDGTIGKISNGTIGRIPYACIDKVVSDAGYSTARILEATSIEHRSPSLSGIVTGTNFLQSTIICTHVLESLIRSDHAEEPTAA